MDAVNANAAVRRHFIETGMEEGLVERNGLEKLVAVMGQLKEEMGDMQVQGLQSRGPGSMAIIIDTGQGPDFLQVILGIESEKPYRITRVELAMGD